ncbi:stage II sporulation protein R [Scopulibacillus darangshiensis]|uniref:Stage II sporulation protein R n=1 Tax=Scopulibacillus darangshiensis TaxID=442528 RepID=A0A4R2NGL0_9BACL|nr:stage II sporulation protein R [Scopulibacillus darangshiensis]TCP20244.1 stage II sporulation protein R [Scopulibacillus darangshiensis]
MKKRSALIAILSLILFMVVMQIQQNLSKASNNKMEIPDDAIRLRILANSNTADDQAVKRDIRDAVNRNIEGWVRDLKTAKQAKGVIQSHLDDIQKTVQDKLDDMKLNEAFTVKLGPAKFPTKMYGGYVYPAGKYEALVITLGQGEGANWWCVLFPPLCFLDFQNGDAVKPADHSAEPPKATVQQSEDKPKDMNNDNNQKDQTDGVEVKFFFLEWITDLFDAIKGLFG